jgi:hypothetical protein
MSGLPRSENSLRQSQELVGEEGITPPASLGSGENAEWTQ